MNQYLGAVKTARKGFQLRPGQAFLRPLRCKKIPAGILDKSPILPTN
jgi:hypothetical protein